MSTALSISDVGLRLIKAYEGFRPVDIELISGQRVAGYGHRVMNGKSIHLSEEAAEALLKQDLAPYEAMINDHVYAPLTQSQFDALCSLAYNIGPKKFLESDVVRSINNGRVLDAAGGFDVWRKGHVNGESYVVDALVRRRTAEKVLFLRPHNNTANASRVALLTDADLTLVGATTAAPEPILEDSGLVSVVNYAANNEADDTAKADKERREAADEPPVASTPMRRRTDQPGGVLTLSEVFEAEDGEDDPLVQELEEFILDLKTGVNADLTTDTDTAAVDEETLPLELTDVAEYDDLVLTDDAALDAEDALESASNGYDDEGFDPADYIVGDANDGNDEDDTDVLELTELDAVPSPIATAAAEVSGRLDALMANSEMSVEPEGQENILPFRSNKPAKLLGGDTKKLREENPLYGSLVKSDENDVSDEKAATKVKVETKPTLNETAQKDSAARYIANNIAPPEHKSKKTGLNALVIAGMTMLGASMGAIMSGWDQRYGAGGEFLSTVGALLGLTITLGSIYYILKKPK